MILNKIKSIFKHNSLSTSTRCDNAALIPRNLSLRGNGFLWGCRFHIKVASLDCLLSCLTLFLLYEFALARLWGPGLTNDTLHLIVAHINSKLASAFAISPLLVAGRAFGLVLTLWPVALAGLLISCEALLLALHLQCGDWAAFAAFWALLEAWVAWFVADLCCTALL